MKTSSIYLMIFSITVIIFLAGCKEDDSSSEENNNSAPEIVGEIGWVVENIDLTYWTKDDPTYNKTATLRMNFWVRATDADGTSDIKLITVAQPNGWYWTLHDTADEYDSYSTTTGRFGSWQRFRSSTYPHSKDLGDYTIEVTDSAGNVATKTRTIFAPGESTSNSSSFIYTEEFIGGTAGGIPMIRKAQNISADVSNDTINLSFTVNDPNVYDGYIWLYDASADYVGYSTRFRTLLNGGLNTDDTTNDIQIQSSDVTCITGKSFSDASGFHILLLDGDQYGGDGYDNRSISEYTTF